uniref:Uncharacterized protein n=1 Tax=Manihot esculenta TaxID=3983 RepID=A0A199UAV9_MANES
MTTKVRRLTSISMPNSPIVCYRRNSRLNREGIKPSCVSSLNSIA